MKKSFQISTELLTGGALVAAGLLLQAGGYHAVIAQALAPFGIGLIISDALGRAGKAARERVKIYIRRDDE